MPPNKKRKSNTQDVKKTPKGKRRSQLSTSFKKQKLSPAGSGKAFKKRRALAKWKTGGEGDSASDSSFNTSAISRSMVSTPLGKLSKSQKRKLNKSRSIVSTPSGKLSEPQTCKLNGSAFTPTSGPSVRPGPSDRPGPSNSPSPPTPSSTPPSKRPKVEDCPPSPSPRPYPPLPQPVPTLTFAPDLPTSTKTSSPPSRGPEVPANMNLVDRATTSSRRGPRPPLGGVLKADMGDMFRNHHFAPLQDEISRTAASSSVCARLQEDVAEVIVIDSDEEDGEAEKEETSAVEELGQEILGLMGEASSQPVPATPRSILKLRGEVEVTEDTSPEVGGDEGNDTIVIDETLEDGELNTTSEEIELVGEVDINLRPLGASNIQDVVTRYQAAWPLPEFIPLNSPMGSSRQTKRRASRGAKGRGEGGQGRGAGGQGMGAGGHGRGAGGHGRRVGGQGRTQELTPAHLVGSASWAEARGRGGQMNRGQHDQGQRFRAQQASMLPNLNFGGFNVPRGGVFRFGGTAGRRPGQGAGRHENRRQEFSLETRRQMVAQTPTIYVGEQCRGEQTGLRPIVIDGSNVAMAHGNNKAFSATGGTLVIVSWYQLFLRNQDGGRSFHYHWTQEDCGVCPSVKE